LKFDCNQAAIASKSSRLHLQPAGQLQNRHIEAMLCEAGQYTWRELLFKRPDEPQEFPIDFLDAAWRHFRARATHPLDPARNGTPDA